MKSKAVLKQERETAKRHLKTMTKNSRSHRVRTAGRIAKYGVSSFSRNIWLSIAATLVMTITLVILLVTVFASVVLSSTADAMRDKIDITVYFKPNTSEETLTEMKGIMERDSNVKAVTVNSSEKEYELSLEENAGNDNIVKIMSRESTKQLMISTLQATMRIKVKDTNNLDSIKEIVEKNDLFVDNVDANRAPTYDSNGSEIATVTSWANIAKNGGLILGAIFLAISILVIFNTIRMAIFSRREEIYMMKLVGADNTFIRGPFLVEAELCGLISGIFASAIGLIGFNFIAPKLESYGIDISVASNVMHSQWIIAVFAATILLGILVGFISARLAIRKYLK